jgi:hypothetical protein
MTYLQYNKMNNHLSTPTHWTPWKSIGFQILLRTKYVPSLVKIHWRILILECSQGLWRTDGRKDGTLWTSGHWDLMITIIYPHPFIRPFIHYTLWTSEHWELILTIIYPHPFIQVYEGAYEGVWVYNCDH